MVTDLHSFLIQHQRPGYYGEHGAEFEAASVQSHADRIARQGWSLIDSFASRSRTCVCFRADLKPIAFDDLQAA